MVKLVGVEKKIMSLAVIGSRVCVVALASVRCLKAWVGMLGLRLSVRLGLASC